MDFMKRHKTTEAAFSRKRFFRFELVCVMLLQKTLKSIQLHIHALAHQIDLLGKANSASVTAGAWTKARAKLKHTAFIELNEELIIKQFYESNSGDRFKGRRLLAIDGSVIGLPQSDVIFEHFGRQTVTNQNPEFSEIYAQAQCCVLYDVLNKLAIKAKLDPYRTSEMSQAAALCECLKPGDIVVMDRGFASAALIALIRSKGADCVVRLPNNSFKESQQLFACEQSGKSITTSITVQENTIGVGKGEVIPIRFVSLPLPVTGEREVLATTLLDEDAFPAPLFLGIYNYRWGIETYFQQLKGRLDLENFSGKTVESIFQDFHAMLFVSNYETILIGPAKQTFESSCAATSGKKQKSLPKEINHSVSYHLIKEYALELFFSDLPEKELVAKLIKLFTKNPHYKRRRERTPHNKTSPSKSAKYRKQVRKITF